MNGRDAQTKKIRMRDGSIFIRKVGAAHTLLSYGILVFNGFPAEIYWKRSTRIWSKESLSGEGPAIPEAAEERIRAHGYYSKAREGHPLPDVRVYWESRCAFRERLQRGTVSGLQKFEFLSYRRTGKA
jgi:hypothetical protein